MRKKELRIACMSTAYMTLCRRLQTKSCRDLPIFQTKVETALSGVFERPSKVETALSGVSERPNKVETALSGIPDRVETALSGVKGIPHSRNSSSAHVDACRSVCESTRSDARPYQDRSLSGIRGCGAMAPKERPFHTVAFGKSLTISGGYAPRKQFVPLTRHFVFIRGGGGTAKEELKECVQISCKEAWLCEMATGQCAYQRPLTRVRILRDLYQLTASGTVASDDKMASLAFDDEGDEESNAPLQTSHRRRGKKKHDTSLAKEVAVCQLVRVPQSASSRDMKIPIYTALDERRRLWIHVHALQWLIQFIRDEKDSGGVAPVEDASAVAEEQDKPRIYWNFRDDNWTARAQAKDGTWLRLSRGVKRRFKDDIHEFQHAKQTVYKELKNWVEAVMTDEVPDVNEIPNGKVANAD